MYKHIKIYIYIYICMYSTRESLPVELKQPVTLDERVKIARNFVDSYGMNTFRLLVDNPEKISDTIDGDQFLHSGRSLPLNYILNCLLISQQWLVDTFYIMSLLLTFEP
jgi:hypothetical protein